MKYRNYWQMEKKIVSTVSQVCMTRMTHLVLSLFNSLFFDVFTHLPQTHFVKSKGMEINRIFSLFARYSHGHDTLNMSPFH